jgi:membrane-associated phospholipid phosphatase
VKFTVRRPRPYKGYPDDLIPVKTTLGYSFPSGHTSLTFSVATSLSLSCPKWYVVAPSMLWASGVAFSRLYLGVHYPSDVLTGMLVGTASGLFGYWLSKRLQEDSPIPTPKMMTMPIVIKF